MPLSGNMIGLIGSLARYVDDWILEERWRGGGTLLYAAKPSHWGSVWLLEILLNCGTCSKQWRQLLLSFSVTRQKLYLSAYSFIVFGNGLQCSQVCVITSLRHRLQLNAHAIGLPVNTWMTAAPTLYLNKTINIEFRCKPLLPGNSHYVAYYARAKTR